LRKVVKARNVGGGIDSLAKDGQTRVILVPNVRPIKKLRRPADKICVPGPDSKRTGLTAVVGASSTIISKEEALRPAHIISIRVEGCESITEEEALSLRYLGVEDVVWSGSKG